MRTLKNRQNEEDLHAWCLLEESENEQWQEVISKQNKRKVKKVNQASLLSVESSHNSNPNSGAAGHVMPETMFPHVKLERETTSEKFVAAKWGANQRLG